MTTSKTKRWEKVSVSLRPKTLEQLREEAKLNHKTLSGEVRYRLERSFEEDQEPPIDRLD